MTTGSKIFWGTAFVVLVFVIIALFLPYRISSHLDGGGTGALEGQSNAEKKKAPSIPKVKWDETDSGKSDGDLITSDGEIHRDVEYANVSGDPLLLDIYPPENAEGKTPLLIWIHGGGWIEGDKDTCPHSVFTKYGYAMACVNYRLSEKVTDGGCPGNLIFPAQIHDLKAAIRWLRKNADTYGFDSENFAVMGDSSGGHLAALLGVSNGAEELEGSENPGYSDSVKAVVDYYGPVDVTQSPPDIVFTDDPCATEPSELNNKYEGENTPYFYWTRAWGLFLGGSLDDQMIIQIAKKASPLTYVDAQDPPFLIIHGKKDGMVPDDQSELLVSALKKAGVEVTYINTEGGHNYGSQADIIPEFLDPTFEFLDKHLKFET